MSPRPTEEEREALRQAAVAAVPIMRKLAEERARLDARIARLQAIVDGYEDLLGRPPRRAQADGQPDSHPRGQAGAHVDAVLMEGGDYREPELRRELSKRFGVTYSRATVYTILRRGEVSGKFEQKEKRWRIKTG